MATPTMPLAHIQGRSAWPGRVEEEDAADDDAFSSKWRRFNAEMLARVGLAAVIQG
jgi:hypothetical protein